MYACIIMPGRLFHVKVRGGGSQGAGRLLRCPRSLLAARVLLLLLKRILRGTQQHMIHADSRLTAGGLRLQRGLRGTWHLAASGQRIMQIRRVATRKHRATHC